MLHHIVQMTGCRATDIARDSSFISDPYARLPPPGNPENDDLSQLRLSSLLTDEGRFMMQFVTMCCNFECIKLQIASAGISECRSTDDVSPSHACTVQSTGQAADNKTSERITISLRNFCSPPKQPEVLLPIAETTNRTPSLDNQGGRGAPCKTNQRFTIDADVDVLDESHDIAAEWDWPDMPNVRDLFIDLHYTTRPSCSTSLPTTTCNYVMIYTDGSAGKHGDPEPSTWSFAVYEAQCHDPQPHQVRLVQWACGHTELDPLAGNWLGALDYSIRSGEGEAIAWALLWYLQANDSRSRYTQMPCQSTLQLVYGHLRIATSWH